MTRNPKIGISKNDVFLKDHDPAWAELYQEEANALAEMLGAEATQIDHIGSTSIPGIKAKPLIDIMIQTETGEPSEPMQSKFEERGYLMRTFPNRAEKAFTKYEEGDIATYNVHIAKFQGHFSKMILLFRDTLRNDPVLAKEYESIKQQAAEDSAKDRQVYYKAKKHFFKKAIGWEY